MEPVNPSESELVIGLMNYGIAAMGLVLVVLGWRKGWASREAVRRGPVRRVGLGGLDLIVAVGLAAMGAVLLGVLLQQVLAWQGAASAEALDARVSAWLIPVSQVVGMGPVAAYVLLRAARPTNRLGALGFTRAGLGRQVGLGLIAGPACLAVTMLVSLVLYGIALVFEVELPEAGHKLLPLIRDGDWGTRLPLLLGAVVLAPVLEELVYRGLLQTVLLGLVGPGGRWLVLVVAAAVFSVVHVGAVHWMQLPVLFVLGLLLGGLYERTGSLVVPIVVHMVFNAVSTALFVALG